MEPVTVRSTNRWRTLPLAALAYIALSFSASCDSQTVTLEQSPPAHLMPLPMHAVGRAQPEPDGMLLRQWPGTYFETAVRGTSAWFRVGKGDVSLRIAVDGATPIQLVKPVPGVYRVGGLAFGVHQIRVQVANESQNAPTEFGGFFAPTGVTAAAVPNRSREIEFIGDSQTVGYGNTSSKHQCTDEEIWRTTDTTVGVPALVGAHYNSDYQVNAISGRGIVRNYNGFAAETMPQAYPYILFDKARPYRNSNWRPQLILISLGTNDFSTPLNPGEKWTTREQLQADYETTFVRFVTDLHQRNPQAHFLFWAANPSPEISSAIGRVVAKVTAAGIANVGFVSIDGLAMTACNWHPSTTDDAKIAAALEQEIDRHPDIWARGGERG